MRHQSFDLRRVTAILLEQKNFGPNVIYYVFWESGGPSADEVDLEVDLKSTSGRPHANLRYLPAHLTHLPQVDLKSTSGRLGSLPRRHRSHTLGITNGTWPYLLLVDDSFGSSASTAYPQIKHLVWSFNKKMITESRRIFCFLMNLLSSEFR